MSKQGLVETETPLKTFRVNFSLVGSVAVDAKDSDEAVNKAGNMNLAAHVSDTVVDYVTEED